MMAVVSSMTFWYPTFTEVLFGQGVSLSTYLQYSFLVYAVCAVMFIRTLPLPFSTKRFIPLKNHHKKTPSFANRDKSFCVRTEITRTARRAFSMVV
jgi:hypothetical protein